MTRSVTATEAKAKLLALLDEVAAGAGAETAMPIRSWLASLARAIETFPVTPSIADTAAALASSFDGDPVDRLIYATAIERGCPLVTKDRRLRDDPFPGPVAVW